jgi:primosomal protein N' (replication factor Y)
MIIWQVRPLARLRGAIVMVPFGGRHLPGIVMGAAIGDVPVAKLRAVESLVTLPPLSDALVQFIERVAAWTMAPLGAVVKMVLSQPAAFDRPPQQKSYSIGAASRAKPGLPRRGQHVLDYLAKTEASAAPDHQACDGRRNGGNDQGCLRCQSGGH